MKHIARSSAQTFKNGPMVDVLEYQLGDKDIDIAVVTMNGDYPDSGFVVNEEVKELLYVISGEGTFATKDKTIKLQAGDQVLVEEGELFRYDDAKDLILVAACTPAWHPAQHKTVLEDKG